PMIPSPHVCTVHALVQASVSSSFPSSQPSPGPWSPSPQTLGVQSDLQALLSPFPAPASHCSLPWITPSPHDAATHFLVQASVSSSHSSSPSTRPLPHSGSGLSEPVLSSEPV